MHLNISIRCLILYCCLTFTRVHSQDLFDLFGDVKDQVVEKVDQAKAKMKEEVRKRVLNLVCLNDRSLRLIRCIL